MYVKWKRNQVFDQCMPSNIVELNYTLIKWTIVNRLQVVCITLLQFHHQP